MLSQEVVYSYRPLIRLSLGLMDGSHQRHSFLLTLAFMTPTDRGVGLDFGRSWLSATNSVLRQTVLHPFLGSPSLYIFIVICSKPVKLKP